LPPKLHRLVRVAALAALLIGAWPVAAQAQTADSDLPVGHFYTQTGGAAGPQYGYRISDEGGIGLWSEFQRLGGLAALGYPISRRFMLDGYVVQGTQKVLLQWRPDLSPPQAVFVNVFDKLHDLGADAALQSRFQVPPQFDQGLFDAGKTPSQAQADRLTLLDADSAIAAFYHRGDASTYGTPTSTVTAEGPFLAVRTQRATIQHWLTDNAAAGVNRGDVTVANGGDLAKQLGLIPAGAALPETINGVAASAPSPTPATPAPATSAPAAPAPASPAPAAPPSAGPATGPQTSAPASQYAWAWKGVNTPPVDCGANQVLLGYLAPHQTPCADSLPNTGLQFIQGHILDQKGTGVAGIIVQATAYGNNYDGTSDQDGTFGIIISNSCPIENRVYSLYIIDGQGRQSSNVYTVNYSDCRVAGEFHVDFVKQA